MYVKPAPGRQVRYPEAPYELMDANGGNVAETQYWLRRLVKGDVVFAAPPGDVRPDGRKRESGTANAVRE